MTDFKTVSGTHKGAKAALPERVLVTVAGQRYVAPAGRHSQQTHLRAQARAEEAGHANEKEQYDADRAALDTEQKDAVAAKQKQKDQAARK